MAWLGLEAEEYDRKYSDSQLGKRILEYLRPYRGKVGLVVLFLTLSSLANGVIPLDFQYHDKFNQSQRQSDKLYPVIIRHVSLKCYRICV